MISPASAEHSRLPFTVESIRTASGSPAKAQEVARHFEAMLIQEVVKAARSASGGGWLGDDVEDTSEATAQMGEEFLANAIAAGGGFGLGAEFARSLESTFQSTPSESTLEKNSDKF